MQNRKSILITLFASLIVVVSVAQNSTDSPYSRYGYGMLKTASFGAARGMGGASIGMRNNDRINHSNPASYSINDSTSFIFDFGVAGQWGYFSEADAKETRYNGNIEHLAIQFPISKGIGGSVGLLPYSQVGYRYGNNETSGGANGSTVYYGEGGLSEAYFGISLRPSKQLSVGANFNYLFGSIINASVTSDNNSGFSTLTKIRSISTRALKPDFGLQWEQSYNKNSSFTLGLTYTPKINLYTKAFDFTSIGSKTDTVANNRAYQLAESFGAGFGWKMNDKWTVAGDVLYQNWSKALYYGKTDSLNNRLRISGGAEYTPNINGRRYYERIRYRFGGYYTNNYINVKNSNITEYGVSIGLGLPFKSSKSMMNLSLDWGQITPEYKLYVKEQYIKFTINIVFNEFWFFKRKID